MLIAEYDYATDIAVQRQEEYRIAFAEGIEQGIEQGEITGFNRGIEQGITQGFSDGARQTKLETALAFKKLGIDIAKIAEGTGLTEAEIEKL